VSETPIIDRKARRHSQTRAEILDAAWALARDAGLAALSLNELARRVGMRPQSLYTYFGSKNAIYDAMFARGYQQYLEMLQAEDFPPDPRAALRQGLWALFRFCLADLPRYQLLFQRTIPGFEPSPGSYALATRALEFTAARLAERGISGPGDLDLLTALATGLVDQQVSNDPGGDRWIGLIDWAADMYADHVLPSTARGTGR